MSSCQGELANKQLYVKATGPDGKVLVDEPVQTMANGFFELWLPRNQNIQLTIQGFNRTATGMIGTFANSKTCLTTFQLK
jgi:hypothetical protein